MSLYLFLLSAIVYCNWFHISCHSQFIFGKVVSILRELPICRLSFPNTISIAELAVAQWLGKNYYASIVVIFHATGSHIRIRMIKKRQPHQMKTNRDEPLQQKRYIFFILAFMLLLLAVCFFRLSFVCFEFFVRIFRRIGVCMVFSWRGRRWDVQSAKSNKQEKLRLCSALTEHSMQLWS